MEHKLEHILLSKYINSRDNFYWQMFLEPLTLDIYVVVQFYPWFKFSFLLFFLGMVMYDNNMIMSLKQKKRKFEPRIKLNHNIYMHIKSTFLRLTPVQKNIL